jgi:hypothetical protein
MHVQRVASAFGQGFGERDSRVEAIRRLSDGSREGSRAWLSGAGSPKDLTVSSSGAVVVLGEQDLERGDRLAPARSQHSNRSPVENANAELLGIVDARAQEHQGNPRRIRFTPSHTPCGVTRVRRMGFFGRSAQGGQAAHVNETRGREERLASLPPDAL